VAENTKQKNKKHVWAKTHKRGVKIMHVHRELIVCVDPAVGMNSEMEIVSYYISEKYLVLCGTDVIQPKTLSESKVGLKKHLCALKKAHNVSASDMTIFLVKNFGFEAQILGKEILSDNDEFKGAQVTCVPITKSHNGKLPKEERILFSQDFVSNSLHVDTFKGHLLQACRKTTGSKTKSDENNGESIALLLSHVQRMVVDEYYATGLDPAFFFRMATSYWRHFE
jgi:hypothetical protein